VELSQLQVPSGKNRPKKKLKTTGSFHPVATLTRQMLSQEVADRLGLSCRNVDMMLVQAFSTITRELCKHEPVKVKHFGKFEIRFRKGWHGRHPATRRRTAIDGRYFVSFSPGKMLKEKVADPKIRQ
jgi:nucleoid DNA-binding protein